MTTTNEASPAVALDDIKGRLAAITPGPWVRPLNSRWKCSVTAEMPKGDPASSLINNTDHNGDPERVAIVTAPIWSMGGFVRKQSGKDLDFIAHAPEDQAKLIDAVEGALAELAALDKVFGKDDVTIRAVVTQVRQAITEALA